MTVSEPSADDGEGFFDIVYRRPDVYDRVLPAYYLTASRTASSLATCCARLWGRRPIQLSGVVSSWDVVVDA